jgi:pyridoxine 5-phosphate synthase
MPDVTRAALNCEAFGAEGITVHPRPDERHIRYSDVREIRPLLKTEFNIEGNPTVPSFVDLVLEVVPDQVTMVPDSHSAITSNAGWNTLENRDLLTDLCKTFKAKGIRTSIFIDPDPRMAEGAAACGADRVELYTADYAAEFPQNPEKAIARYLETAKRARECGLGLNAGHDLSLENLAYFIRTIPWTDEVSIGHALISDALYMGLEKTIQAYLSEIRKK